jgi:hypothetical protein
MAIERIRPEIIEEFDGIAKVIEVVPDQMREGGKQYHIGIEPTDKDMLKDTKTGMFHIWLRIGENTKDNEVSEGSKLDNFLRELETTIKEARNAKTVIDSLNTLKNKEIHWVKKVLGKSYGGYESKPVFVPRNVIG